MKILSCLLLLMGFTAVASADVPKKKPVATYNMLWNRSLITVKPPPPPPDTPISAFDDWALMGVSQVKGGYMVSLVNKKKQGESQIITPQGVRVTTPESIEFRPTGKEKSDFTVVRVDKGYDEKGIASWKRNTVLLSAGGKTGVVRFEDDLIAPKQNAAPAPPQPAGQPAATPAPQAQNGQPAPAQPAGIMPPRKKVNNPPAQGGHR